MTTTVLITRHPDEKFTARAFGWPDIIASGNTEDEALEKLRIALTDLQAHSHVREIDLSLPTNLPVNSLAHLAGIWIDDPDWDVFQDAIASYRRELDSRFNPV